MLTAMSGFTTQNWRVAWGRSRESGWYRPRNNTSSGRQTCWMPGLGEPSVL